jgi:hypothetical protein
MRGFRQKREKNGLKVRFLGLELYVVVCFFNSFAIILSRVLTLFFGCVIIPYVASRVSSVNIVYYVRSENCIPEDVI